MAKRKGHMPVQGKIIILVGILVGAYFIFTKTNILQKIAPKNDATQNVASSSIKPQKRGKDNGVIDVGVVTWGGYAGGQYFNGGFNPNQLSNYYKQYGLNVKFHLNDNVEASVAAWRSGEIDVHWTTIDAYPTQIEALLDFNPKIFFQSDWSRGGDAIVVSKSINNAQDLYGKKIAVAFATPSHSFLLYVLDAADLLLTDVELVPVASAMDAAKIYISRKVDAAVVWSPDDDNCIKEVPGTKVLMSTKTAKYIIADVFYARESYLQEHQTEMRNFVEGWLKGAAEINAGGSSVKNEAARILHAGFGGEIDMDFCRKAIDNVRLTTYGDNRLFFGLDKTENITGEKLYTTMSKKYKSLNMCKNPPVWSEVVNVSILESLSPMTSTPSNFAEGKEAYSKPTVEMATAQAVTTKKVTVEFSTGSDVLSQEAKSIIDRKFADILNISSNRIRIEGNTDKTGSRSLNMNLSSRRAQSVATYLVQRYNVDPNRFIIVGNGPDKPVCYEDSDICYSKNRRTEFQLLN